MIPARACESHRFFDSFFSQVIPSSFAQVIPSRVFPRSCSGSPLLSGSLTIIIIFKLIFSLSHSHLLCQKNCISSIFYRIISSHSIHMTGKPYTSEEIKVFITQEVETSTLRFAEKLRASNRKTKVYNPSVEYV